MQGGHRQHEQEVRTNAVCSAGSTRGTDASKSKPTCRSRVSKREEEAERSFNQGYKFACIWKEYKRLIEIIRVVYIILFHNVIA